jgi:hypothetical protein
MTTIFSIFVKVLKRVKTFYILTAMKKALLTFVVLLFILPQGFSQLSSDFNYYYGKNLYPKSMSLQAGAVINSEYNALKFNLESHNLLFKYVGFYTSFETGLGNDYFSNIIGVNVSFLRIVYAYAGIDFFTKDHGIIHGTDNSVRKEIGLGLFPVKNLVIRMGFSIEVGATVTAGYRIPFHKKGKSKKK